MDYVRPMIDWVQNQRQQRPENRRVMTVFEEIQNTSPYDFVRTLDEVSRVHGLPSDFSSYVVRAMNKYQERVMELNLDLATEKGKTILTDFQLAEQWGDILGAFDNMRPTSIDRRTDRRFRAEMMMFMHNTQPESSETGAKLEDGKFTLDERADMLAIKKGIKTLFANLIEELDNFEMWAAKASDLRSSMNAGLYYDLVTAAFRLVAETQIGSVKHIFQTVFELSTSAYSNGNGSFLTAAEGGDAPAEVHEVE